ncbi:cation transporter [Paraburkholderia sp. BL9I2N2]|uniref:cation transporter n=1 Tax=Paraburkholderia sp. BL9I2N2 TaxID=1938809 RepID=UPI001FB1D180|nr:cation transporter [Paraburkholderia sp. BL9I2N2]
MKARSSDPRVETPRAVYYALTSNVAVAICKYAVAFYTNSGSALAEAIHSSADCLNQFVLLLGRRSARALPDEQHRLGFGRET